MIKEISISQRLYKIGRFLESLLPFVLLISGLCILILSLLNLKTSLTFLDKGITISNATKLNSEVTSEQVELTELRLSSNHPVIGEPVELEGWLTNVTTSTLQIDLGLFMQNPNPSPGVISDPDLSNGPGGELQGAMVMRVNNASHLSVLPGEKRSFHLIFEVEKANSKPISLGAAVVGTGSTGTPIFTTAPLTEDFQVQPAKGLEIITGILQKLPVGITLLMAIALLAGFLVWKIPALRARFTGWQIMEVERTKVKAIWLYSGSLLLWLIVLGILILPLGDTDNFTLMQIKRDPLILLWVILPVILIGWYGRWSRSLILTALISFVTYLQLFLDLGNRLQTTYLIIPALWLFGAALAAGSSMCLLRSNRSFGAVYLLLCSIALTVGASSSFIFSPVA